MAAVHVKAGQRPFVRYTRQAAAIMHEQQKGELEWKAEKRYVCYRAENP